MEIQIEKLDGKVDNRHIVIFKSPYGIGKALWEGSSPIINQNYFVELEIYDVLKWGSEIVESINKAPNIYMQDENVYIVGVLETCEEDGYTDIRVGKSLVTLETNGEAYSVGTFVRFKAKNLTLYDEGI
jgi:hypothetical protein